MLARFKVTVFFYKRGTDRFIWSMLERDGENQITRGAGEPGFEVLTVQELNRQTTSNSH